MSFHSPFGNPSPDPSSSGWDGAASPATTAWSPGPSPDASAAAAAWHPPPALPPPSALAGLGWAESHAPPGADGPGFSAGFGGEGAFVSPPPPPYPGHAASPYASPPPPRPSPPWARPSGPRVPGLGCEDSAQGLVSADGTPTGGVVLRITLLAAGFVIGPGGASVRDICRASGADVRSFTERPSAATGGRPVRAFVVEGPPAAVATALAIMAAAVDRYVELTDGRAAGALVPRAQTVGGVTFSYQPPPKAAVPGAAGLKGSPRRAPPPPPVLARGGGAVAAAGNGGGVWSPPRDRPLPGAGPSRSRDMLVGLLHRLADEDEAAAAAAAAPPPPPPPPPRALRTCSAPAGLFGSSDALAGLWTGGGGGGGGGGDAGDRGAAEDAAATPPASAVAALRLLLDEAPPPPAGLPPRGPGRPPLGALPAAAPAADHGAVGDWTPARGGDGGRGPLAPRALGQPLARAASAPGPVPQAAAAAAPWVKGGHPLWPE